MQAREESLASSSRGYEGFGFIVLKGILTLQQVWPVASLGMPPLVYYILYYGNQVRQNKQTNTNKSTQGFSYLYSEWLTKYQRQFTTHNITRN